MHPSHSHPPSRVPGLALIVCATATVALLAAHPGGGGTNLAQVLRSEAADQAKDALVHGGFVVLLAIELVGFAVLAVRAGAGRTAVLAAMAFTLFGSGLLSASMILDGLVTPAIATRYTVAPPEKQEAARALLVLIGSTIRYLMPMGLGFLAAATVSWGVALLHARARIGGLIGLAMGAVIALATVGALATMADHLLIVALAIYTLWTLTAGVLLVRGLKAAS